MDAIEIKEQDSSCNVDKVDSKMDAKQDKIMSNENTKSDRNHQELVKLTKEALDKLIDSDPFLSGLPLNVTVEEIKAQIAVAQGQAIMLFLIRKHLPKLSIVVPTHTTTVLDLKKAIKRHTNLYFKRENIKKKISWKHVWKKYNLCFENIHLTNDNKNLKAYGISNKAELYYIKKYIRRK
ncbi:PREDICTED: U11/U12 small nuclear ribonucleoprotein 25 kDa protein-like [Polistes dominula]|uniref:U11/U12 small nuclear ribonucleoprotein 25 kDa protein-like n=1 Tax=Polistes dominula TaxID=743375 RepID=A0ABM1J0D1_POLDO|nr:PREDICTED: U11/U12 small nuclear ribonucleoprotein 25 kDa protein-like [Polistes dominula]